MIHAPGLLGPDVAEGDLGSKGVGVGRRNTQPPRFWSGEPRMAALSQHLRILLWKNWLSVKRQLLYHEDPLVVENG
ncbi:hypothetical protein DV515_00013871 [Chloebia gouldiae]|uniref:Uncharacterized protein n=1 Tax=Chloebia gouldiae TaxID=44316 RepID=A0A3L8RZX4_CHLGU|nr:hypothetical protein DV515_00013871 [Chloebia gouldiae]